MLFRSSGYQWVLLFKMSSNRVSVVCAAITPLYLDAYLITGVTKAVVCAILSVGWCI